MNYLLGLDIGTSGVKAILISVDGKIIDTKQRTYPLSSPRSGWTEQNPGDWWQETQKVIAEIIQKNPVDSARIKALSLSGQMHSSVFLDKNREVIRPAILWSDTRTSKQCQEIYNKVGGVKKLINQVSNKALEGFTAPKILWLRENEPANYEKISTLLLPKDYIRYKLTGELATEESDAAGTILYDVKKREWSTEVLKSLNIDKGILPPVLKSIDAAGKVSDEIAKKTGLKAGTPVIAGGADNACGAVGSGIVKEGKVMVSIGSSGVVLAQTNEAVADQEGRIHLFNHANPGSWYLMGVMLSAGMSFSWLKESLYDNQYDYSTLNKKAAETEPGSDGLLFLPYLYGERAPYADADARGVHFGISGEHKVGHFARSVMEGVSFGLKDSLELMRAQEVKINEVRAIGGGSKSKIWQQILADILGEEISLINIEEGPAFGAALIAGVGIGVYNDFKEVEEKIIKVSDKIKPIKENVEIYQNYYQLYQSLYDSLESDFKKLTSIRDSINSS